MRHICTFALAIGMAPFGALADDCDATRETLRRELAIRFSGPDDPGTLERRSLLQILFAQASPACAKELHEQLGAEDTGEELSSQFHYALATPTRKSLRDMLRARFEPLDKLDAAIDEQVNGAAERDHLHCWVGKLRESEATDKRAIPWRNVCPQDEQTCQKREHPTDQELAAGIQSKADVEGMTPERMLIFQSLDSTVEAALLTGADQAIREMLELRRQLRETQQRLGAENLPGHYSALAEWLAEKDADPNSVLSCPRLAPSSP